MEPRNRKRLETVSYNYLDRLSGVIYTVHDELRFDQYHILSSAGVQQGDPHYCDTV